MYNTEIQLPTQKDVSQSHIVVNLKKIRDAKQSSLYASDIFIYKEILDNGEENY